MPPEGLSENRLGPVPTDVDSVIHASKKDLIKEGVHNFDSIIVFDDVTLPLNIFERLTNVHFLPKTNIENGEYILGMTSPDKVLEELITTKEEKPGMELEKRSEIWRHAWSIIENHVIKSNPDDADPIQGYLYFGNQDFKKILKLICQVNPFFASALTLSSDHKTLELIAYKDTAPSSSDSLYLKMMRDLSSNKAFHQINVYFTKEMDIRMMKVYDAKGEGKVVPESEWDYYASGVLFNFIFYASSVHATMHVLHYLMTAGIYTSCSGSDLSSWADQYDDNTAIKYVEVAALLLDAKLFGKAFGPVDDKIVTGKNGLGGSSAIMPILRELLCEWGTCKDSDDYMKKFMVKNIYDELGGDYSKTEAILDKFDVLVQFRKCVAHVKPFAEDLAAAMKKDNSSSFHKVEHKLKKFMSGVGKGVSSIDSISSWVQLMSVTGITHGSTLSYSRLVCTPEVMRWRNPQNKYWDEHDIAVINDGTGTMQGMIPDRHVFTSSNKVEKDVSSSVKAVLDEYDSKAEVLKVEYQKSVTSKSDFREFGWILTDWCRDGFDGKQQTVTTYI